MIRENLNLLSPNLSTTISPHLMKISEIKFKITLDENNLPENISWEADDAGVKGIKNCKSFMISMWDSADTGTLRIDLWTKKMPVDEMQRFFYETFMSMADTYQRATNEKVHADLIREFATSLGKKINVLN